MMIDVIGVKSLGGHKLEIEFSDGTVGATSPRRADRWPSR
jgi:hypothetical protein